MQFSSAAIAALFAASAVAVPVEELIKREEPPPMGCTTSVGYNVTSKSSAPILGSNAQTIAMTCDGTGGHCTLGTSESYSVSWSINVGLNLNLSPKDIQGNAGLTVGYTYSATKGTVDSASLSCPDGPWICGVSITPWVMQVSGYKYTEEVGECGSSAGKITQADPYTVQFPQVTNNLPDVNAAVCACPNANGASASGAPAKCPQNC